MVKEKKIVGSSSLWESLTLLKLEMNCGLFAEMFKTDPKKNKP
jgi:hypothetical protein